MNLDYSSRLQNLSLDCRISSRGYSSLPTRISRGTPAQTFTNVSKPRRSVSAADMAKMLNLSPGQQSLILPCGRGSTSVFFGASNTMSECFAVERIPADRVLQRPGASQVSELITPVRADARQLPSQTEYFDASFCRTRCSFGTDDLYPPYILRFLKPGARWWGKSLLQIRAPADAPEEILRSFRPVLQFTHQAGGESISRIAGRRRFCTPISTTGCSNSGRIE